MAVLKGKPGSVNPFSLKFDPDYKCRLIMDQNLKSFDKWAFHPLVNTATVELKKEEFQKYMDKIGRTIEYIDLGECVEEVKKVV